MNLVLIPLQTNQPPACPSHTQQRYHAAECYAQNSIRQPAARDHHTQTTGSEHNQEDRQRQMEWPGVMLEMSAEDREETKDFDAE